MDKFFIIVILLIIITSVLALFVRKEVRDQIKSEEDGNFCADDFIMLEQENE